MTTAPLILGFDSSEAHCAAALLRGDRVIGLRCERMGRGQAERLMPMLEELLAASGVAWRDLTRIGVGIGPGNFTGIRISVSAARGLALGLGIPAIGVSTFDVIFAGDMDDMCNGVRASLAAVPAARGFYLMEEGGAPFIEGFADPPGCAFPPADPRDLVTAIARIAATRPPGDRPAPLYVRPADAAPPRDAPPRILDDA